MRGDAESNRRTMFTVNRYKDIWGALLGLGKVGELFG